MEVRTRTKYDLGGIWRTNDRLVFLSSELDIHSIEGDIVVSQASAAWPKRCRESSMVI